MKQAFIILLTLVAVELYAQAPKNQFEQLYLNFDNKNYSFSSLAFKDGKLFLPAEDNGTITMTDTNGQLIKPRLKLDRDPSSMEIEGATVFKNKLYLLSEKNPAVYYVNTVTGEMQLIKSPPLRPLEKNGYGLEGIATNEKRIDGKPVNTTNKLYLLFEKTFINNNPAALLFTYSIIISKVGMIDSIQQNPQIDTLWLKNDDRYSDICFDAPNNRLLLLRSARNSYAIESLAVNEQNGTINSTSLAELTEYGDLTSAANAAKAKGHNNNLEGITIGPNGCLYIVSDNNQKDIENTLTQTLLLKSCIAN